MAPSSESGAEVEADRAPDQAGRDTAFAPGSSVPGGTGLASIMGNRATARAVRGLRDTLPPGARAVAPANVMLARAAVSRTGRRALQRDVGSDDYKAGYDDGLGGQGTRPAPRDGDALIDYEEGFAKGEYDAKHASASPAPAPAPNVTPAPADTPAPGPVAGSGKAILDMTGTEKLSAAYDKAHIKDEVRKQIADLVKPEALFVALVSFATVYLISQATPVGWAADLGVLVTAVFIGSVLFDAIKHLLAFADAVNATSDKELQAAGDAFAAAIVEIGIQTIILLATHKAGGGPEGTAPLKGPTPAKFADLVTNEGVVVRVPVDSLPAAATKPLATPQDAVRAAAAVNALMKAGGAVAEAEADRVAGARGRAIRARRAKTTSVCSRSTRTARRSATRRRSGPGSSSLRIGSRSSSRRSSDRTDALESAMNGRSRSVCRPPRGATRSPRTAVTASPSCSSTTSPRTAGSRRSRSSSRRCKRSWRSCGRSAASPRTTG